jgi:adenosylcobinamide kinase/adenosylcobinamide-phosphate guanylyltransferase
VRRHQEERGPDWITVEEPLRLSRALEELDDAAVVLVDCLTLWINNLLFAAETENRTFDEYAMEAEARRVLDTAAARPFPVIFVTNEVGAGITPENKSARLYRDLVGRCNRMFAQRAEEVYLVACGLPLTLKRSSL